MGFGLAYLHITKSGVNFVLSFILYSLHFRTICTNLPSPLAHLDVAYQRCTHMRSINCNPQLICIPPLFPFFRPIGLYFSAPSLLLSQLIFPSPYPTLLDGTIDTPSVGPMVVPESRTSAAPTRNPNPMPSRGPIYMSRAGTMVPRSIPSVYFHPSPQVFSLPPHFYLFHPTPLSHLFF